MIYRVVENRRKVIISSGTAKRRAYVVEQFFSQSVCRSRVRGAERGRRARRDGTADRFHGTADRKSCRSDRKFCQPSRFPGCFGRMEQVATAQPGACGRHFGQAWAKLLPLWGGSSRFYP